MKLLRCAQVLACAVLLLFGTMATPTTADCPDADIRCRIAVANSGTTSSTQGCEGGASVTGTINGEVPSGSVTVDGKCYLTVTDTDDAQYMLVGTITIGQCYDLLQGGCQPDHCPNNSPGQRCNEQLANCQIPDAQPHCTSFYTVVQGDDAWTIANNHGTTLAALQEANPGVDLSLLQPNQQLCLTQAYNYTPQCEGKKISG
ncbi:hypothetical protein R1flu_007820 [Riccia fluitans]|uniref:LysM domain-containing protein n=1 Tax=Riccia fluitans TaxID=41844 RepID=A0ABD1Z004_9MARC